MRDPELIVRELKLLHLRLAELDLIAESQNGEDFTYLSIKSSQDRLMKKQNVAAERDRISEKLREVTREYIYLTLRKLDRGPGGKQGSKLTDPSSPETVNKGGSKNRQIKSSPEISGHSFPLILRIIKTDNKNPG